MSSDSERRSSYPGTPLAYITQSLRGYGIVGSDRLATQRRSAAGASPPWGEVSMEQLMSEQEDIEYVRSQGSARSNRQHPSGTLREGKVPPKNVNAATLAKGKELEAELKANNNMIKVAREHGKRAASTSKTGSPFHIGRNTLERPKAPPGSNGSAQTTHGPTAYGTLPAVANDVFRDEQPQAGPSRLAGRSTRSGIAATESYTSKDITQSRRPLRHPARTGPERGQPSWSGFTLNGPLPSDPSPPGGYPASRRQSDRSHQPVRRSQAGVGNGITLAIHDVQEFPPSSVAAPTRRAAPVPHQHRTARNRIETPSHDGNHHGSSDIPPASQSPTNDPYIEYQGSPERTAPREHPEPIYIDQSDEEVLRPHENIVRDHQRPDQTPVPSGARRNIRPGASSSGGGPRGNFGSHKRKTSPNHSPYGRKRQLSPSEGTHHMKIDTRQAIRMLGEPEDIEDPDDWPDANGKSSRTGGSKKRVDKGTKAAADSDDENEIKIIPSPLTSHQSNVHGRSADLQASAQKPPPKRSLIGSMRDKNGQVVPIPKTAEIRPRKHNATQAIPSSNLTSTRDPGPVTINYARYCDEGTALTAFTFRLRGDDIELGSRGANHAAFVRLPMRSMTKAEICVDSKHAFAHIDVNLRVLDERDRRRTCDELQYFTPKHEMLCEDLRDFGLAFALNDEQSTSAVLTALGNGLKDVLGSQHVTYLDSNSAEDRKDQWRRIPLKDTRARAEAESERKRVNQARKTAEAAEKRARPARKARDSDASSATDAGPGKKNSKHISVDPNQSKLNFTPQDHMSRDSSTNGDKPYAPRRSHRVRADRQYHEVGDSDEEAQPKAEVEQLLPTLSSAEKQELLFPYPLTGRAELHITGGDRFRVKTGDFLNDTLLEFGLRHRIASLPDEMQCKIHLFNSFFYDKLSSRSGRYDPGTQTWPAYNSVRKWTKGKSIFDMKYIIVPINEAYHWYLAVIVNPGGILKEKAASGPPEDSSSAAPPVTRARTSIGKESASGQHAAASSVRYPSRTAENAEESDSDLNELQANANEVDELSAGYGEGDQQITRSATTEGQTGHVSAVPRHDVDADGDTSMGLDPLTLIGSGRVPHGRAPSADGDGSDEVRDVQGGCERISLDDTAHEDDDDDLGAPISTLATRLHGASFSQVIQSSNLPPADPDEEISHVPAPSDPSRPNLQIHDSDKCWIITCDSLGGQHRAVKTVLERWLQFEARDKLQTTYRLSDASYVEAKVPQQNNFSDCGLWLIHYVYTLLQHPKEVIGFIERPVPYAKEKIARQKYDKEMHEVWRFPETQEMRPHWEVIINSLRDEYRKMRPAVIDDAERVQTDQDVSQDVQWLSQTGGGKPDLAADQASHMPSSSDIGRAGVDDARHGQTGLDGRSEAEEEEAVEDKEDSLVISAGMSDKTEEEEPVEGSADDEEKREQEEQEEDAETDSRGAMPFDIGVNPADEDNIDPQLAAFEPETNVVDAIIPDSPNGALNGTNATIFAAHEGQDDPRLDESPSTPRRLQLDGDVHMDDEASASAASTLNTNNDGQLAPSAHRLTAADQIAVTSMFASAIGDMEEPAGDDDADPESPFSHNAPRDHPRRGRGKDRLDTTTFAAPAEDVFQVPAGTTSSRNGGKDEISHPVDAEMDDDSDGILKRLAMPHQPLQLGSDSRSSPSAAPRTRTGASRPQNEAAVGTNGSEPGSKEKPMEEGSEGHPQANKPVSSSSSVLTALMDELESVNDDELSAISKGKGRGTSERVQEDVGPRSPSKPKPAGKRSAVSSPGPRALSKKQKTGRGETVSKDQGKSAEDAISIASSDGEESAPTKDKGRKPSTRVVKRKR